MSIDSAGKSHILERRLHFLRETFTYNLYRNVCRSLFERDKVFFFFFQISLTYKYLISAITRKLSLQVLYSFILCTTIMLATKQLTLEEMSFFLTGGLVLHSSSQPNPAPDWLADKAWEEIKRSANLSYFAEFPGHFSGQELAEWKKFYDSVNPEEAALPEPWQTNMTEFQKLIVMRMIRPDKVIPKVHEEYFLS